MIQELYSPLMVEKNDRIHGSIEHRLELAFQSMCALFLGLCDSQQRHTGRF
jgi:hypothetical protein